MTTAWLALSCIVAFGCGRVGFSAHAGACVGDDAAVPPLETRRYVAPAGGSDSNPGSEAEPWATVAHALASVTSDETIVLLDGTYSERLNVTTPGRRIRAATDGGAIFDAGGLVACEVRANDVSIEGIVCRSGTPATVWVRDSMRVQLRRITAQGTTSDDVFRVQASTDVLIEDVAAWGVANYPYLAVNSTRVTFRRCWGRWETSTNQYNAGLSLTDDTFDSVVENCVFVTRVPDSDTNDVVGINVTTNDSRLDRNHLVGNVISGMPDWSMVLSSQTTRIEGTRIIDNVLLSGGGGLFVRSDAAFGVERLTASGFSRFSAFMLNAHATEPKNPDFEIAGYLRDSVLASAPSGLQVGNGMYVTAFEHTNNTLFDNAMHYRGLVTPDASESIADPGYDVDRYGRGAHLIRNAHGTGAEILYRTEDRVLTDVPLWPWPMEDRIAREAGESVTWESAGGLWKVLPDELVDVPACE